MVTFIALLLGMAAAMADAQPSAVAEDAGALHGTHLTPENQDEFGFAVFVDRAGCEASTEWRVEIQHPRLRMQDAAMMAELRWQGDGGVSLTAQLFQKAMGPLLITDFCAAPALLSQAQVTLWYGGYSRSSNIFISDLQRWLVD